MAHPRNRTSRPHSPRRGVTARLESLEPKRLLTVTPHNGAADVVFEALSPGTLSLYQPVAPRIIDHFTTPVSAAGAATPFGRLRLDLLDNDGKTVSGRLRDGTDYSITVHGPGEVIVQDITPGDGVLFDNVDSITLIGTDPLRTFVSSTVSASPFVVSSGTVPFNKLYAPDGVASINLNGFVLTDVLEEFPVLDAGDNVVPEPFLDGIPDPDEANIYLPGGVGILDFAGIDGRFLTNVEAAADELNVVIGEPTSVLTRPAQIRIGQITNTVADTGIPSPVEFPTDPTVNIIVNGPLADFRTSSITRTPPTISEELLTTVVDTTGRTAIRATEIGSARVIGSANNTSFSRGATPFQGPFSGLGRAQSLQFGGNVDALAIDVDGPIGLLQFARGAGGLDAIQEPSDFGSPRFGLGGPNFGFAGAVVDAGSIGSFQSGPAELDFELPVAPQDRYLNRLDAATFITLPGQSLDGVVISSRGDIGHTRIDGTVYGSEFLAGHDLPQLFAGQNPIAGPSRLGPVLIDGDVVDSIFASSYAPVDDIYGNGNDVAGDGSIDGQVVGNLFESAEATILGSQGTGFFANRLGVTLPFRPIVV